MKADSSADLTQTDNEVRLVINGGPLANPTVGVGVYTLRLIRGLLGRAGSLSFRVALDEALIPRFPDFPREILVSVPSGLSLGQPILNDFVRAGRTATVALRRFPKAVFHSPGPMWSRHLPLKTVVTLHDCISRHFPLYLGRFWVRKWMARAAERYAARSSMVLTDSEFSARDLAATANIPAGKIRVLYPWLSPEFESSEHCAVDAARVRARFNLPDRFWLYLGGYDYRKNVEALIEAYAAACDAADCPKLVLAGKIPERTKPPYSDVMGSLKKWGLDNDRVVLPGVILAEDLAGLYAGAELLVYPSLFEGFGFPPAEAIAAGTSVLVADTSSLPEVVRNPHCLFDPKSKHDLITKLVDAAARPDLFRCKLPEEFTERVAIPRYLELISSL